MNNKNRDDEIFTEALGLTLFFVVLYFSIPFAFFLMTGSHNFIGSNVIFITCVLSYFGYKTLRILIKLHKRN